MLDKTKGVIENVSHTETDDYITRTYVMPLLFDDESRRRLIAEHRNSPVGNAPTNGRAAVEHSHELRTILDKMRRALLILSSIVLSSWLCSTAARPLVGALPTGLFLCSAIRRRRDSSSNNSGITYVLVI